MVANGHFPLHYSPPMLCLPDCEPRTMNIKKTVKNKIVRKKETSCHTRLIGDWLRGVDGQMIDGQIRKWPMQIYVSADIRATKFKCIFSIERHILRIQLSCLFCNQIISKQELILQLLTYRIWLERQPFIWSWERSGAAVNTPKVFLFQV